MQVMEAIAARRSIRAYQDRTIEPDKLAAVAEAFRLAPSARNAQDWQLYVIHDADIRRALWETTRSKPQWLLDAPVILAGVGTNPHALQCDMQSDAIDVSIAFTCAMLAAHAQGLGTCWMASFDQAPAARALSLPEGHSVVVISPLGYPAETPPEKPRKGIDEVLITR